MSNSTGEFKHGASAYNKHRCRCGVCRSGHREALRTYADRRKAREGVHPTTAARRKKRGGAPLIPDCVTCGEPLKASARSAVPMHKACRPKPRRKRVGPSKKFRSFQRRIERAARGTSGGKRVFVNGPCAWCGVEFTAPMGKYCSAGCAESARFKRQSTGLTSFTISPRDRLAIYERDAWVCQLCFYPIDRAAHYMTNWAPSLDHIVPQSLMLVPDHSAENLRCVHRLCNSMRGADQMTQEELLARVHDLMGVAS